MRRTRSATRLEAVGLVVEVRVELADGRPRRIGRACNRHRGSEGAGEPRGRMSMSPRRGAAKSGCGVTAGLPVLATGAAAARRAGSVGVKGQPARAGGGRVMITRRGRDERRCPRPTDRRAAATRWRSVGSERWRNGVDEKWRRGGDAAATERRRAAAEAVATQPQRSGGGDAAATERRRWWQALSPPRRAEARVRASVHASSFRTNLPARRPARRS